MSHSQRNISDLILRYILHIVWNNSPGFLIKSGDAKGIQVVFYFYRITGFTFFLPLQTLYLILCFSHAKGKLHDKTLHARLTLGLRLPWQDFQETFEAHCFNRVGQGEVFVAGINNYFVCGFDFMTGIMKSLWYSWGWWALYFYGKHLLPGAF